MRPCNHKNLTSELSSHLKFIDAQEIIDLTRLKLSIREKDFFCDLKNQRRRIEFLRGRYALKSIISDLKTDRGENGELILEENHLGSLSHTSGHVLAFACKQIKKEFLSVGIDIELHHRVKPHLSPQILTENEQRKWGHESLFPAIAFSAKESVFKCVFPILKKNLSFHEVFLKDCCFKTGYLQFHLDQSELEGFDLIGGYRNLPSTDGPLLFTWCLLV